MTCRRIETHLAPYRQGILAARKRTIVEAHLARCPECARLLALLEETDRALAAFPQPRVSDRLRQRLYALPRRTDEKTKPARAFFPRLVRQPLFVPAAVMVLAVTIFVTNPNRDTILRSLNRQVHLGFSKVEKIYAQAGSVLDKLNAYKEDALVSLKSINPLSPNGDKK
jgi:anti-sigma factor RsiW